MLKMRNAEERDLDALYEISLATGHLGADASHLYDDRKMVGHLYSAPYLMFSREMCLVAEDHLGVSGFVVGAIDTASFDRRLEYEWWPNLRDKYGEPNEAERAHWTTDQRRSFTMHHPEQTPEVIVAAFPSHLHMNLLPRLQGRGVGVELLKLWLAKAQELGAVRVHVGSNTQNLSAAKFWEKCGFLRLEERFALPPNRTMWLGRSIW